MRERRARTSFQFVMILKPRCSRVVWDPHSEDRGVLWLGPTHAPWTWFPYALVSCTFGESLSSKPSQIMFGFCHGAWNILSWNIFICEPALWARTVIHSISLTQHGVEPELEPIPNTYLSNCYFYKESTSIKKELPVTWEAHARP